QRTPTHVHREIGQNSRPRHLMKHLKTYETISAIIDDVFKTYDQMKTSMRNATVQVLIDDISHDISAIEVKTDEYLHENPEKRSELEDLGPQEIFETENFISWLEEDIGIKY